MPDRVGERIPVSPYIARDGAIVSLIGMADRNLIKLSDNRPLSITSSSWETSSSQLTIEAAGSLGYAGMIDVAAAGNTMLFLYEQKIIAEPPVDGAVGSIVLRETYGIAIRIAVKIWGVDISAEFNLGSIAASSTVSMMSSSYQVDVIGLPAQSLTSLPELINGSTGPFDLSKFQALGALAAELDDYIIKSMDECRPELLEVEVDFSDINVPYESTTSQVYALGRVAAGFTGTDALSDIPTLDGTLPPISTSIVTAVFTECVGNMVSVPNQSQMERAQAALVIGNGKSC